MKTKKNIKKILISLISLFVISYGFFYTFSSQYSGSELAFRVGATEYATMYYQLDSINNVKKIQEYYKFLIESGIAIDTTAFEETVSEENFIADSTHSHSHSLVSPSYSDTLKVLILNEAKKSVTKRNTKNRIDDDKNRKTIFSLPDSMKFDKTYEINILISKNIKANLRKEVDNVLKESVFEKPTSLSYIESNIKSKDGIWVEIIEPDNKNTFKIYPSEKVFKNLSDMDELSWQITPIGFDDSYLMINMYNEAKPNTFDKIYTESFRIKIKYTLKEQIIHFWEEYWQWILGTVCIPLLVWMYNKFTGK